MSYTALGGDKQQCMQDEIFDAVTGQCVPFICPDQWVSWYGTCISPEKQDELGPGFCDEGEQWVTDPVRGCLCKPGTHRVNGPELTTFGTKDSGWCEPDVAEPKKTKPPTAMIAAVSISAVLAFVALVGTWRQTK